MAEWIESKYGTVICSNCGKNPTQYTGVVITAKQLEEYKYCRFCGEKMTVSSQLK